MQSRLAPLALTLVIGGLTSPAMSQQAGEWMLSAGAHQVNPKSNNGSLVGGTLDVSVGSNLRPTIAAEYFIRDNLGIEVLGAWPFEHDIRIAGLGRVGSTQHLPPTVTLNYHFGQSRAKPFVGLGLNYTLFMSEDTAGALANSELELDDSFGLALHVGLDFKVSDRNAIRIDARWIDIDTDATLNGGPIGTVNIDPLVYGIAYVFKF